MEYRKMGNVYAVRIDRGEEVLACLSELAEKEKIETALVEGIGAADLVEMGLYDVKAQKYMSGVKEEPLEITSLLGNITRSEGRPYLHLHITVADQDHHTFGGHLNRARIGGTCELFVTVYDGAIGRKKDTETGTGLNLFAF